MGMNSNRASSAAQAFRPHTAARFCTISRRGRERRKITKNTNSHNAFQTEDLTL